MKKVLVFLLACLSSTVMFAQTLHYQKDWTGCGAMNTKITGVLTIDDVEVYNGEGMQYAGGGNLEIGVFDQDGICRGATLPGWRSKSNQWVYQMQFRGVIGYSVFHFKVYDHATETELDLIDDFVDEITYQGNYNYQWNGANSGLTNLYHLNFTSPVTVKTFVTAGNWNVDDNWNPAGVPTIDDDVVIAAAAIIPNDCVALANNITIDGGSITIADGGQLMHNNNVTATVKKFIQGYGEDNYETKNGYYLIANPTTSTTYPFQGGNFLQGTYDLYKWTRNGDAEGKEWTNYKTDDGFPLEQPYGYLYANMDTVTLTFTGTVISSLNTKTIGVEFSQAEFGAWNLLGNPFVCNAYLTDSYGNAQPYYKMNDNGNGFEAVTGDAIAPGTGIFYETDGLWQYTNVYFTRVAPAAKAGQLNMMVNQGRSMVDNAIIRFGEGQQMSKFSFRENSTKVYIPMEGKDYAVVSAEAMGELPVNFKAEKNGSYSLSFSASEVNFSYLHLIDNLTGNDVNLLETPSYSFNATTSDYTSRFRLVFATSNSVNGDSFGFLNGMGNLCIFGIEGEATVQVVDVLGHVLSSETFSGSYEKRISAAPGVYMIRLIQGNDVKVQKVVVK